VIDPSDLAKIAESDKKCGYRPFPPYSEPSK